MNTLLHALHAERLKLRHTLALWLCLLAPLVCVPLGAVTFWSTPGGEPHDWTALLTIVLGIWNGFLLPLFVTLEAALLAALEHGNAQWKHLLALPLPRGAHYAAKLIVLVVLSVLTTAIVVALVPLAGLALHAFAGAGGFADALPLGTFAIVLAKTVTAMLLMLALQWFIAARWPSFVVAMSSGIVATTIALFLPRDDVFGWFPWKMPAHALTTANAAPYLLASVTGFVLVAAFGMYDFTRRDHR